MKNNNKKFFSLLNSVEKIFKFIKSIKYKRINKLPLCRIEQINLIKKIITIHCKGIDSPIKLTFNEIINDSIMLSNLSPKQASLIGYYYGKHYKELISEKGNRRDIFNFDINESLGKYHILMLNRDGNLIYGNHDGNATHIISPMNLSLFTPVIIRL